MNKNETKKNEYKKSTRGENDNPRKCSTYAQKLRRTSLVHRHTGQFFYGVDPSLHEKYFDSGRKNAHLTWPNSMLSTKWKRITSLVLKTRLWTLHLAGWNEFHFSFNKYQKSTYIFIFGCWLLQQNPATVWRNTALPDSCGMQPSAPRLVRLWLSLAHVTKNSQKLSLKLKRVDIFQCACYARNTAYRLTPDLMSQSG